VIYYKEVRGIRDKRYRGAQVNSKKNIPSIILSFLKIQKDLGSLRIHKILFPPAKPSVSSEKKKSEDR